MKKSIIYLLGISTLLVSSNLKAQENKNVAQFGVKGGLNLSTLYTDNIEDKNTLIGFNAGVFAKVPLTSFIALQPEVYYTTKGAEITYNNVFANGTARFRLNYIEVPLLLVINLTKNINIQGGPYVAYLLNGKTTNESNVNLFDFEKNINTSDYNRIDGGVALGAAVDVGNVGIGARYSYGMTTVGKERDFAGTTYTFPDSKNGVFNLFIAFSLK